MRHHDPSLPTGRVTKRLATSVSALALVVAGACADNDGGTDADPAQETTTTSPVGS